MTARRTRPPVVVAGLVLALVAGAAVLTGCDVPSGPQTTEQRDVGDVTSVRLTTSGDLTIEQGDTPQLTVTAAKDALPYLTSDTADGALELGVRSSHLGAATGTISYHLVVGDLEQVVVEGSGDVTADAATGERLDVQVDGSGDVDVRGVDVDVVTVTIEGSGAIGLTGRATGQAVRIEGSGDYRARSLDTQDATVSVEGSGDVEVTASGTLGVRISGSGSVTHAGGATVTSDVDGSGQVREG